MSLPEVSDRDWFQSSPHQTLDEVLSYPQCCSVTALATPPDSLWRPVRRRPHTMDPTRSSNRAGSIITSIITSFQSSWLVVVLAFRLVYFESCAVLWRGLLLRHEYRDTYSIVTPEATEYSKLRIVNDSIVKLLGFVLDPELTWDAASQATIQGAVYPEETQETFDRGYSLGTSLRW